MYAKTQKPTHFWRLVQTNLSIGAGEKKVVSSIVELYNT